MKKLLFLLATMFACQVYAALKQDQTSYQGVNIYPGDVINLRGGLVTTLSGKSLTYGHTALYLGIDPQNGQRRFFDFTTNKDAALLGGSTSGRPFLGRILDEKEFLTVSAQEHTSFDVFRLNDASHLNQHEMLQEAKRVSIARTKFENTWGVTNVCVSATTHVLSKATGMNISFISPDGFMGPPFHKLPELNDRTINIQAALEEVNARQGIETRSAQLSQLVPQIVTAQKQARRTELTAEEAAMAQEYAKDEINRVKADYVTTVVDCACSDPNTLEQLDGDGHVPGTTIELVYLKAYYLNERKHLSGCEIGLFEKIIHESPNLVSIPSMTEWARNYRWQHSLAHHVSNTIRKFGDSAKHLQEAISDALASSGSNGSSGSSSSSSGGSSSSNSSSGGSGSSVHFSSSAYNQASGINATGHW
jgi:hypothetical protein